MPPRSTKGRGGSQRWLVVPFVLTLGVVLVDASMHARSPRPEATLDSQAWVDKVLPSIAKSSAQGNELAQVSSTAIAGGGSTGVAKELAGIARATASTYKAVVDDGAPPEMASAAGLLQACLAAREKGAAEMATAVRHLLDGNDTASAVGQMTAAAADFRVSDNAYRLFTTDLPKLGVTVPASVWAPSGTTYQASQLNTFAGRLVEGISTVAPHKLHIDAITTNPPALRVEDGREVLSPAKTVSVTAVIADLGQSAEKGVKVTASITPALGAPGQQVSASANLSPGQALAVQLPGLKPAASKPTRLTIGALEPAKEPGSAYRSITIEVPGPNFGGGTTGTTTTTATT